MVGFAIRVRMVRRDVPAWLALIPEFAINPIAVATSSAEYPIAPATGATYLNVSPIMPTLVFALEDACARTSAKCVESCADKPNAVSASVTISDVVAKSSPDAAARFMIPSMPFSISLVFQPAIAMYCIASADSVALNFVFAPISFALSVRAARSSPVAPEIASTFDIPDSKLMPISRTAPAAFLACDTTPVSIFPAKTDSAFFPISLNFENPDCAVPLISSKPFLTPLLSSSVPIFTVPS